MPPTNVLDHLTPDEVLRLLERRPDGLLARGVIRTVQDLPGQTITRIEIDEDRVHVYYARPCHPEEVGYISARLLCIDAEACPDGMRLEFVSGTGAERQSEVLYVSL